VPGLQPVQNEASWTSENKQIQFPDILNFNSDLMPKACCVLHHPIAIYNHKSVSGENFNEE
jgi:hypothetical protein